MAAKDNLAYEERQGNRKGWREEVCVTDKRLVKVEFQSNYKPKPTHSIRSIKKKKKLYTCLFWSHGGWSDDLVSAPAFSVELMQQRHAALTVRIWVMSSPRLFSHCCCLYYIHWRWHWNSIMWPDHSSFRIGKQTFFYRVDRIVLNRDGSTYRPS